MSSKSSFYNSTGVTNTQSNAIDASVDNAEASATASENSANNASASASTATTKASEASTSAATATTKASEASTSASTATTKASEASTSAATATTKASESASSATASANSATAASTSASTATTKASEASSSASTALSHKNDAQTAKTAAETAETNAETAETNAASSATAASTSASSASTSASTATTKAGEAATSASTATTKANEAATSASNASTAATTATTKASEASASASSAASSATAASASKDAALAALDSFDDRYLGVKSSNPSVDNDGNALVAGSLYFNSTDDTMKVYEGSTWVAAYASLSGALIAASNLSDLSNVATARTNLGLGTAATTAATAYATAAQGTKADNALPKAGGTMTGNLDVGGTVTADAGSWSTVVSGNAITFDRNGENNIIADSGSSANLNLTAGNRIFYSADDYQSFKIGSSPTEKLRILSTGIDVTGTVTADGLTVQSNNNLDIHDADNHVSGRLRNVSGGNNALTIEADPNNSASGSFISLKIDTSEKMRIDSSGNLLVGMTTDAANTVGIRARGEGLLTATRDGSQSAIFGRKSSDGDITLFQKDGTTVGSIFSGHGSTQLGIGTNTTGITFNPNTRSVMPADPSSTNPQLDATLDLGFSSVRWKDLYLSGGLRSDTLKFSNLSGTERMRIDSSGNVGIGTSSPTHKLHVDGTLRTNGTVTHNSANLNLTADDARILIEEADGTDITWLGDHTGGGHGALFLYNHGGSPTVKLTADSHANYINNGNSFGIGTSSPSRRLHVKNTGDSFVATFEGATNSYISWVNTSGTAGYIGSANGLGSGGVGDLAVRSEANLIFLTNAGSERMRIDSSGNLLVGTTTSTLYNATSGTGFSYRNGVALDIARENTSSAQPLLNLNLTGVDGSHILFYKDGSTVGSIGVSGTRMHLLNGDTGLRFAGDTNSIFPCTTNGADSNNAIDLGASGNRFKDFYVGGGVYLGGTGSANKLDDYEEGTWTPTVTAASGSVNAFGGLYGTYTKIGREVSLHFQFIVTDVGSSSGNFIVGSLPFAKETSTLTYYLGIHRARSGTSSISELTSSGALHLHGTTPINSTYLGSIVYTTA